MKKVENKSHRFGLWLLGRFVKRQTHYGLFGDMEEMYKHIAEQNPRRAKVWLISHAFRIFPSMALNAFIWRWTMIKNYLKTAFRNMIRYKGFTFINTLGLALGLVCCILILLYVRFEMSYDRYHPDYDRIYRISLLTKGPAGEDIEPANTPLLSIKLKEQFPQVESVARMTQWSGGIVIIDNKGFRETYMRYTDPKIFKIFHIPFINGDPETALNRPGTVVLTRSMVEKYFADENPMGKSMTIHTNMGNYEFEVTGVVEDPPHNTHFKYRTFLSYPTIQDNEFLQGRFNVTITYVKLKPGTDIDQFESLIRPLSQTIIKGLADEDEEAFNVVHTNFLQPIAGIHLHSHLTWEMEPSGKPLYLTVFSGIGALILLIACVNFMNLTTARSSGRGSEVGVRKVVGAQRSQLIQQFLSESMILSFIALVIALIVTTLGLSIFNSLALTQFTVKDIFTPTMLLSVFVLVIFTGIAGGSYPAFFLSAFKPVSVLKSRLSLGTRGGLMRKTLVIVQFTISIALIISTLTIRRQLSYMKGRHPGFHKEQKLILPVQRGDNMIRNFENIKNEFLQYPAVEGATASSSVPGRGMNVWWTWPSGEESEKKQLVNCLFIDYDFLDEFGIQTVMGRTFRKQLASDSSYGTIILNEAAVQSFGWSSPEEALDKIIWEDRNRVVGVFKDFHWQGLQHDIEPLLIMIWPRAFRYITLTVNTADLDNTMDTIEKKYQEWFPDHPFEPFFLDVDFDSQYRFEERIGQIFRTFAFIGIFIACMGLFGLASFIAEQRTKEIGIRKVLGASESGIVVLLSREFVKWVIAANLIAWPVAWFAMNRWLQGFAYRASMGIWIFLLSGVLALVIALLSVTLQSIRAAKANPVDSLRYE